MNEFTLHDAWAVSGTDKDTLYKTLKELSDATITIPVNSSNIEILTIRDADDTLNAYLHNSKGATNVAIPMDVLTRDYGATPELISETMKSSFLMFKVGKYIFFATKKVLKTLSQRAGSALCDFAERNELSIRFPRDTGYMNYMCVVPSACQMLVRKLNGASKVYAVFTDRYKMLPQYPLIKDMIESFEKEMGECSILYYNVDHFNTEVIVEFPEKAKDFVKVYSLPDQVVPGLRIHLSDTGESSFIIDGTIRVGRTVIYVPGAEYSRAHTRNADFTEMREYVGKHIFAEYTKIPDRLLELLQIPVVDPAGCIRKVFESCEFKKILGAAASTACLDALVASVNPGLSYTAYDIASMFLEEGQNMERFPNGKDPSADKRRCADSLSKLRNLFAKAVFYRYEA